MAVVIRMKRTGRRNSPCYRICVAEKRLPRNGRTLDTLGVYDPASPVPDLRLKLDVERARQWLDRGALPSDTVRSIFKREGVYEGRPVKPRRKRGTRSSQTATAKRRKAASDERAARKAARQTERVAAKRAAKKEAAAAAAAAEE
jgi:small subunit ribosomal protein S16